MSKENNFPNKRDLALIGLLAFSACNPLESPQKPPEMLPTPTRVERPVPTIGPAVLAVRVPEKDRGVGH